ncbi:hypothetical protein O6H91_01G068700 [Diphasiastrum complanatum]|uniref:Uncharacterized protein n=1 Tax=Diphasiastrum complanatum TaxID=34168 RepID=A0ACC2ES38_DIPCM|nr:hypothetical protein O6H91_Y133200 [Diphasiastrum complanatum]KAJ7569252.1 hypothetical protein O6H91_01G068700 [Diphasiastrum complanatum]
MAAQEIFTEEVSRKNSKGKLSLEASESTFDVPWASDITTEECKCECCGLLEEFTAAYIKRVRDSHCGQFVCGLCADAVDEEVTRRGHQGSMTMKAALSSHMTICAKFNRDSERADPTTQLVAALASMKQMLLRRMIGSRFPGCAHI